MDDDKIADDWRGTGAAWSKNNSSRANRVAVSQACRKTPVTLPKLRSVQREDEEQD